MLDLTISEELRADEVIELRVACCDAAMSPSGQKHVLPRRSITACFSSNSGYAL
jgi:hypothetical protein